MLLGSVPGGLDLVGNAASFCCVCDGSAAVVGMVVAAVVSVVVVLVAVVAVFTFSSTVLVVAVGHPMARLFRLSKGFLEAAAPKGT